jgi:hypothetical protein
MDIALPKLHRIAGNLRLSLWPFLPYVLRDSETVTEEEIYSLVSKEFISNADRKTYDDIRDAIANSYIYKKSLIQWFPSQTSHAIYEDRPGESRFYLHVPETARTIYWRPSAKGFLAYHCDKCPHNPLVNSRKTARCRLAITLTKYSTVFRGSDREKLAKSGCLKLTDPNTPAWESIQISELLTMISAASDNIYMQDSSGRTLAPVKAFVPAMWYVFFRSQFTLPELASGDTNDPNFSLLALGETVPEHEIIPKSSEDIGIRCVYQAHSDVPLAPDQIPAGRVLRIKSLRLLNNNLAGQVCYGNVSNALLSINSSVNLYWTSAFNNDYNNDSGRPHNIANLSPYSYQSERAGLVRVIKKLLIPKTTTHCVQIPVKHWSNLTTSGLVFHTEIDEHLREIRKRYTSREFSNANTTSVARYHYSPPNPIGILIIGTDNKRWLTQIIQERKRQLKKGKTVLYTPYAVGWIVRRTEDKGFFIRIEDTLYYSTLKPKSQLQKVTEL